MSWQLLASVTTNSEWVLTEPVTGSLFRISHSTDSDLPSDLRAIIGQAFNEEGRITYFDVRRVAYKLETEAIIFNQPEELIARRIAVKRLDSLPDSWTIQIEVFQHEEIRLTVEELISNVQTNLEEIKMTLTNPITVNIPSAPPPEIVTSVIKTTVPPPTVLANAVVIVSANNNRRGLTIWNETGGDMLLEFDGIPTFTSYGVILRPGGYYESQYGFVGEIQAIFNQASGTGALVREFVINTIES